MHPFIETWNPNQGDLGYLMTTEEFVEAVNEGLFIDDDGFANPAIRSGGEDMLIDPDTEIRPSDIEGESPFGNATHVVWYNR